MSFNFQTKQQVKEQFSQNQYISNTNIDITIFNAVKLQAPLLIEGPAGVGKTEIAKVLAKIFQGELIRIQCYEGIDFSKVLYDYNYSKQLLYVNLLKENAKSLIQDKDLKSSIELLNKETDFFGEHFLMERPLLKAISPKDNRPKILLIDEIDKSDAEFESFLLEILSDFSVSIPEYGTISAVDKPIVVLTSNGTRDLSEALKRRCVYLYIDYPDPKTEANILVQKVNVEYDFANKIALALQKIRRLSLKQKPSIAETINWTKALLLILGVYEFNIENKGEIDETLNVLLKNHHDIKKLKSSNYLS